MKRPTLLILLPAIALAYAACGGAVDNAANVAGDAGTDGAGPADSTINPGGGDSGFQGGPPVVDSAGDTFLYETGGGGPGDSGAMLPPEIWDANLADGTIEDAAFDATPAPVGLAGFAFVVNGVVGSPMACPSDNWEYPLPPGEGDTRPYPPIVGVTSAFIVNTGAFPLAYIAQSSWNISGGYIPGVLTGEPYQLAGVLDPGMQVDITTVYTGGITAVLGSAAPFSSADAGHYASDEGTIPWPAGVAGSGGASTMHVAEIEVPTSPPSACRSAQKEW